MTAKQVSDALGQNARLIDVEQTDEQRISFLFAVPGEGHHFKRVVIDAYAQGTEEAWLEVQVK